MMQFFFQIRHSTFSTYTYLLSKNKAYLLSERWFPESPVLVPLKDLHQHQMCRLVSVEDMEKEIQDQMFQK